MNERSRDDHVEDDVLVANARHDKAAFAVLYRRYAAAVYQYCDRCLGNRDAAEDATQTIFLHALAALSTYRDRNKFRGWLFAIAHNEIISRRRSYRRFTPLEAIVEVPDQTASPEDLALAAIERREITALLSQLSPELRHPVELHLQGLNDQEIAHILGRSHGAIRTARYRAKHQVKSLLMTSSSAKDPSYVGE